MGSRRSRLNNRGYCPLPTVRAMTSMQGALRLVKLACKQASILPPPGCTSAHIALMSLRHSLAITAALTKQKCSFAVSTLRSPKDVATHLRSPSGVNIDLQSSNHIGPWSNRMALPHFMERQSPVTVPTRRPSMSALGH